MQVLFVLIRKKTNLQKKESFVFGLAEVWHCDKVCKIFLQDMQLVLVLPHQIIVSKQGRSKPDEKKNGKLYVCVSMCVDSPNSFKPAIISLFA